MEWLRRECGLWRRRGFRCPGDSLRLEEKDHVAPLAVREKLVEMAMQML